MKGLRKKHVYITHRHGQPYGNSQRVRGEVGGGGEAVEEMGASVLVSTIKENKLRKNTRKMALGQSC